MCIPGFIDGLIEQIENTGENEGDTQSINPIK